MPFTYKDYGTFTGPNSLGGDYNYDTSSKEGSWYADLPIDTSFKLTDLATVLFHIEGDYVGFYCNGTSTQLMTFAHSNGNIPTLRVQADTTIHTGKIIANDSVIVNGPISANVSITCAGAVTASSFNGPLNGVASGNKVLPFDIPHVTQKGKRIRHVIAEGPEAGIYVRGKIKDTNVIELPEYWDGLIDPETITVTLTQIGYSQDLIVDKIEWGKNIIIRSGVGANVHCYYEVWAARWLNPMNHDEKLIVVYEGETPDDYPGDNKQFLIGGWDYDRRNPQWEPEGQSAKDYPGQDWLNLRGE